MRRIEGGVVRNGWRETVKLDGLVYNEAFESDNGSYWQEGPFYSFSMDEVLYLEESCGTMFEMCIAAGHYIINNNLLDRLKIPRFAHDMVKRSWERKPDDASVYGRFDIRYGGELFKAKDPTLLVPKILEFNADTPTSLVESSIVQWNWHLFTGQGKDQWNSIHERLIEAWKKHISIAVMRLQNSGQLKDDEVPTIHFAFSNEDPSGEDLANTQYLMETAIEAGFRTKLMCCEHIKLDETTVELNGKKNIRFKFLDKDGEEIKILFKLYPWEWILEQDFNRHVVQSVKMDKVQWIEPIYKMLWSNKGILPILWELFKDDPDKSQFLIPAYFEEDKPASLTEYVRKPLLGREGANVEVFLNGEVAQKEKGIYGEEGYVVQEYAAMPTFHSEITGEDHRPILGFWTVDEEPAGCSIRETSGLITDCHSNFLPHCIDYVDQVR